MEWRDLGVVPFLNLAFAERVVRALGGRISSFADANSSR
jgi:hypothetical protein